MAVEVSTFAELVAACANASTKDSENVVKLANNISVVNEFPNGGCPQLTVNCTLDGNGKTINDWYCTRKNTSSQSTVYMIYVGDYGKIRNLTCSNINHSGTMLRLSAYNKYMENGAVTDCFFSGKTAVYGLYGYGGKEELWARNSFNLECGDSFYWGTKAPRFQDCRFILETDTFLSISSYSKTTPNTYLIGCLVEDSKLGNMAYDRGGKEFCSQYMNIENCVLDITPKYGETFTICAPSSSGANSILRGSTWGAVGDFGSVAVIDEEHWLNAGYVKSVAGAFNAYE